MTESASPYKRPESVLVVVYTQTGKVLLLKRADHPDFWQSVTGSMRWDEDDPRVTVARELEEETGIQTAPQTLWDLKMTQCFPILPQWRHRYAPDATQNVEHAFAIELAQEVTPRIAPREHTEYDWFSFDDAQRKVASWANRNAIRKVQEQLVKK